MFRQMLYRLEVGLHRHLCVLPFDRRQMSSSILLKGYHQGPKGRTDLFIQLPRVRPVRGRSTGGFHHIHITTDNTFVDQ